MCEVYNINISLISNNIRFDLLEFNLYMYFIFFIIKILSKMKYSVSLFQTNNWFLALVYS